MKKIKSHHYLLILLAILTTAASALAYTFLYRQSIVRAESAVATAGVAQAAQELSTDEKKAADVYTDTASERAQLPTVLVSESNAVPFIDAIESIGPISGAKVSLSSLSSGTDAASSHATVNAVVSMSGSWPAVMRALQLIENLPYAVSAGNISLSENGGGSVKSPHLWILSLSLSALSTP